MGSNPDRNQFRYSGVDTATVLEDMIDWLINPL